MNKYKQIVEAKAAIVIFVNTSRNIVLILWKTNAFLNEETGWTEEKKEVQRRC